MRTTVNPNLCDVMQLNYSKSTNLQSYAVGATKWNNIQLVRSEWLRIENEK